MILRADGLRKSYATGVVAVSHAELKVEDGEFISIVGRSGSGKSTLLAMIGALTRPTEGRVLLGNDAIWTLQETELADLRCREFGFVFQFPSLLPNLQVIDNVALPALLGRTLNTSDAYSRANILLERTGLGDRIDAYPAELSGGEQRRVAIARALINRPRLLLADEPTGDLDEDTENDIIALLERLRQETALRSGIGDPQSGTGEASGPDVRHGARRARGHRLAAGVANASPPNAALCPTSTRE